MTTIGCPERRWAATFPRRRKFSNLFMVLVGNAVTYMIEIRDFFTNLFTARQSAGAGTTPAPSAGSAEDDDAGAPTLGQRTVRDTVTLSEGGQKYINLARGQELAQEIRNAPTDGTFEATLKKALDDVFRVVRLFTESLKARFTQQQKF